MEPPGSVPWERNVPLMLNLVPLFHWIACLLLLKGNGVRKKHSSVSGWSAGHKRYW